MVFITHPRFPQQRVRCGWKSSEMGFLLTESVALEAPKGPHWCAEGPWLWAQQRTLGWSVTMRVTVCCWGWAQRVWMMGAEWRRKREAVGDPGLEKESRNGGRNQAQWPKTEECAVCRLSGL